MVELSNSELKILHSEIEKGGLTYTRLHDELLDHLCCDIEMKMEEGMDFPAALDEVKKSMGRDCIVEIQEETLLLINQKYSLMKKLMYIIGTIAPSMVIIGTILKIMHWPGSGIMMTLGLVLLAAIYLPVFVSIKIRDTRKKGKPVNRSLYYIGMVSGIIFIAGALFKTMHWPGASIMTMLAAIVSVGVFIPMLVVNAIKDKENQVNNFTLLIFVLSFVAIISMTIALTVSKDVASAFVIDVENNMLTDEVIDKNNQLSYEYLEGINLPEDQKSGLKELVSMSEEISVYIDQVIKTVILESHSKNINAIGKDGKIDFYEVLKKDNMNVPARIMLGIERDVAEGEAIKSMLEEFKLLASRVAGGKNIGAEDLLATDDIVEGFDHPVTWVSHNFEHLPMMSVISQLTRIDLNCSILEGEVLRTVQFESGLNTLQAER